METNELDLEIIEVTELRIGNALRYKGCPVHVTMLSLDIDDEYTPIIGFCKIGETTHEKSDWNRALVKHLRKIKLNDGIVEKAGFKLDHSKSDFFYGTYEKAGIEIYIEINKEPLVSLYGQPLPIKYLHELQNLHYYVTGEEIQFELQANAPHPLA